MRILPVILFLLNEFSLAQSTLAHKVKIPIEIQLEANIGVDDDYVFVKDLGKFSCRYEGCGEVENTVVMSSPEPGKKVFFNSNEITTILKQKLEKFHLVVVGSGVTVTAKSQKIEPSDLESLLDSYLSRMSTDEVAYKLKHILPVSQQIRPGVYHFQIHQDYGIQSEVEDDLDKGALGIQVFAIPEKVSNRRREFFVKFTTVKFCSTLAFSQSLDAGTVLEDAHLKRKMLPCSQVYGSSGKLAEVLGKMIKTKVSYGQVVSLHSLRVIYDVHKGDLVKMNFRDGPLVLRGTAKAIKDGVVGDSIPVLYQTTKQVLSARIIAPGAVTVVGKEAQQSARWW